MKKIKIAFCLRDMQLGGVESVLIRTLDKLQEYKNIEISIITYVDILEPIYKKYFESHKNIKCFSLYPSKIFGTKLPHFFLARIFAHLLRDIYRGGKRLLFGMRKFKDIDVFIDYHDFGFYSELKNLKQAKKIAWCHSSIDTFVKRKFINKIDIYDSLVVLTDEFINDFNKLYGVNNKLIRIYNPVDIDDIKSRANVADKNNLKNYLCCVARLTPDKDIETVLRGFDLFWNNAGQPGIKMVFVGDGNMRGVYESIANSLSAKKQFVFMGAMKNPFGIMRGATANILSSKSEGLPTVLVESAVLGTLNIASKCKCGPCEILEDGKYGMLFDVGNFEQLSQCLLDVYRKNIDINKMIRLSTKALNRFDADVVVKQIISLFS